MGWKLCSSRSSLKSSRAIPSRPLIIILRFLSSGRRYVWYWILWSLKKLHIFLLSAGCPGVIRMPKCVRLPCDTRILRRFSSLWICGSFFACLNIIGTVPFSFAGIFLFKILILLTEYFLDFGFAILNGGIILIIGLGGSSVGNSVSSSSSEGLSETSLDISSSEDDALGSVGGDFSLILLLWADLSCLVSSDFWRPLISCVRFSLSFRCSRRSSYVAASCLVIWSKLFCRQAIMLSLLRFWFEGFGFLWVPQFSISPVLVTFPLYCFPVKFLTVA